MANDVFDLKRYGAVADARERLERAEEEREAATERLLDAEDALERAEEAEARGETPEESRQTILERLPQLRSDLRVAKRREEEAREELDRAEGEALDVMEEELKRRYGELVGELWRRLHAAADVHDEVRALYRQASQMYRRHHPEKRTSPLPEVNWTELDREGTRAQSLTRFKALENFLERNASWMDLPDPNGNDR